MATIIGTYRNRSAVQKVVHDLRMAGFGDDNVHFVSFAYGGPQSNKDERSRSKGETIAINVVLGGIVGVFLTVAFSFFIGLDPIVTGFGGAVLGAIVGTIIGIFTGKETLGDMNQVEVDAPDDRRNQVTEILEKYEPVSMAERANGKQLENHASQNEVRSAISREFLGTKPKSANETNSGDIPAVRESVYYDPERLDEIDTENDRFPEYEFYLPDFYKHFQQHYANEYSFQDYEPAYRYGYSLAADHRHDDFDWYDIEPGVRDHWKEKYDDTWEKYKDAIRYAWDRLRATTSDSPR